MSATPPKTESIRSRLATWMIPPTGGWRRKSLGLLWSELSWPLGLFLLSILAFGLISLLVPAYARWIYVLQIALLVVAAISVFVLLKHINHQLIEPLAHMRNWALRMRGGNLSARIPVPEKGEFAELARDVNNLGDELRSLTLEMNQQVRNQTVRLARKTQSLDILYEIATSLNKSLSLDELLDGFLDTLMDLVDARAGTVRLLTAENQTRIVASRGLNPKIVDKDRTMDASRCHCGWAATDGKIKIQQGTHLCTQLMEQPYLERECSEFVVVPIQYQGHVLGVYNLFLDKPLASLGEDARDLLVSIGRHLGLAIEKARLDHDARRLAIMEERQMLGSELHDSLAQSLVGMRLQIKMLGETLYKHDVRTAQNEVRRLRVAVEEAHLSLRELLSDFRLKIDERGLIPAIGNMVERTMEETGISIFFQNDCQNLDLSPTQEIQVFRIIQEALTNIRKHSQARNARILLSGNSAKGVYTVLIEDDGLGMAPAEAGMPGEHFGLSIMRERAERVPGELSIESEPGEGTRVMLTFHGQTPASAALA